MGFDYASVLDHLDAAALAATTRGPAAPGAAWTQAHLDVEPTRVEVSILDHGDGEAPPPVAVLSRAVLRFDLSGAPDPEALRALFGGGGAVAHLLDVIRPGLSVGLVRGRLTGSTTPDADGAIWELREILLALPRAAAPPPETPEAL